MRIIQPTDFNICPPASCRRGDTVIRSIDHIFGMITASMA